MNPTYKIEVSECGKLRRASATIRNGTIQVKLPRRWPRTIKEEVTEDLVQRIRDKDQKERALLAKIGDRQARITIRTHEELALYVHQLNRETFQIPRMGKIQIGDARYNHLAQVNLRTKTMTVSKFCLNNVPADALRYLIVHEMAHYFEAGHNKRFWALVGQHVPDYRLQSRLVKAFHHQAVMADEITDLNKADLLEVQTTEQILSPPPILIAGRRDDDLMNDYYDLFQSVEERLGPVYEPDFDFHAEAATPAKDRSPEASTAQPEPVKPTTQKPPMKKPGSANGDKPGILQQVKQMLLWGS